MGFLYEVQEMSSILSMASLHYMTVQNIDYCCRGSAIRYCFSLSATFPVQTNATLHFMLTCSVTPNQADQINLRLLSSLQEQMGAGRRAHASTGTGLWDSDLEAIAATSQRAPISRRRRRQPKGQQRLEQSRSPPPGSGNKVLNTLA